MRASSIVLILLVYSIYQFSIAIAILGFVIIKAILKVGYIEYDERHKEKE